MNSIDVIEKIIEKNPQIKEISLGAYKYVSRALSQEGRLKIYNLNLLKIKNIRKKISSIKLDDGWDLSLISKVKIKGGSFRHIPQIDFECPVSYTNLKIIKAKLSEILKITPGYIINSGASYHFIGLKLLNEAEWHYFMGLCLLLTEYHKRSVVDIRWCGYQLMNNWSCLRILEGKSKPKPKVIVYLN